MSAKWKLEISLPSSPMETLNKHQILAKILYRTCGNQSKIYCNKVKDKSRKKIKRNFICFLLSFAPFFSTVVCLDLGEEVAYSPVPFQRKYNSPNFHHLNLYRDYLRNWFLCHLTWSSDGETSAAWISGQKKSMRRSRQSSWNPQQTTNLCLGQVIIIEEDNSIAYLTPREDTGIRFSVRIRHL